MRHHLCGRLCLHGYQICYYRQLEYLSLYRHFLYSAFHGEGSLKIPIPLVLRHVPQPNTEQLSPGSLFSIQQTQKTIPVERTTLQSFKNSSGEV